MMDDEGGVEDDDGGVMVDDGVQMVEEEWVVVVVCRMIDDV